MKIYVTSRIGRKLEMRGVRDRLVDAGHTVTSRWINMERDDSIDEQVRRATIDVEDVRASEVLLAHSDPPGSLQPGGGRHVEFGIALERGLRIMVIGPRGELIFHYCPGVMFYSDLDEVIEALT